MVKKAVANDETDKLLDDALLVIEKDKEIVSLTEELTRLRESYDNLNKAYTNIVTSKSWKITKPIRMVCKVCVKLKKELYSKKDKKQSILFLVQDWVYVDNKNMTNIGGTALHVIDIINQIKEEKNCYVLTIIDKKYVLVTFDGDSQLIYDLNVKMKTEFFDKYDSEFSNMIDLLIDNLQIDLVHIHHIMRFPCDIKDISKKVKTIHTIHDYTLLCPRNFLVNTENEFCTNGSKKDCRLCLKEHQIDFSVRNDAVKQLIENVDANIVPDESIIKELDHYYSIANYEIIPHGIDTKQIVPFTMSNKKLGQKINIAFVGLMVPHKGLNVARDLVFNNNRTNIIYHLFGTSSDERLNMNQKNYVYHGLYNKTELPKLLNDNKIDLVLLLSTCPESYSYVLSEVAYAKVPAMSFDIGALANRIKKDKIGWVIDAHEDVDYKNVIHAYNKALKKESYNEVIENLKQYKDVDVKDMIDKTVAIYDKMYVKKNKKYYLIQEFIEKYPLTYKL